MYNNIDIDSLKFYVINLEDERGLSRRNHVIKVMSEANMPFEFFKAYNKDTIVRNNRYIKKEHRDLINGEIALAMSHNDIYKDFLNSNDIIRLIAEDDITIKPNFKFYLNKVINSLPIDFDFISLEYIRPEDKHKKNLVKADDVPDDNLSDIIYDNYWRGGGTAAYIVSRKGAEYFLKLNEPIWLPSDGVKSTKWQKVYMDTLAKIYYVIPRLAYQGNFNSLLWNF